MRGTLLDLYAYTRWANKLYIDCMLEHKVQDEQSQVWLSHIFNAYEIWLSRIEHYKPNYGIWDVHALKELPDLNKSYIDQIENLVSSLSDADLFRNVHFQSSDGKEHSQLLKDILIHIANHSTHHRAQIAVKLRALDIAVPPSDYIFFKRD